MAAGVGPPIGGALVELGGWRWAFLVNLPFGVVALWAARQPARREPRAGPADDARPRRAPPCSPAALALLNLGIVKGADWGWTSPQALGSFAGAGRRCSASS